MKAFVRHIVATSPSCCWFADLGDLALRLVTGLYLAAHGYGKIAFIEMFAGGVANLGFPAPRLFACCALLAELAGGSLLALGLFTRPAALFIAVTMGVAAFMQHAADPLVAAGGASKEPAVVYLAIAFAYLLRGAGRLSFDYLIERAPGRENPHPVPLSA